jgi:hypothetical protein
MAMDRMEILAMPSAQVWNAAAQRTSGRYLSRRGRFRWRQDNVARRARI